MAVVRPESTPDSRFAAIEVVAAEGLPIERSCEPLGVSVSGYSWLRQPPSARSVRHAWLTEIITEVHATSPTDLRIERSWRRADPWPGHCCVSSYD